MGGCGYIYLGVWESVCGIKDEFYLKILRPFLVGPENTVQLVALQV